jgi:hypothetical protein
VSTELLEITKDGVALMRFWGGDKRGVCYQITAEDGTYLQLTTPQLNAILSALADSGFDIGWAWRNQ